MKEPPIRHARRQSDYAASSRLLIGGTLVALVLVGMLAVWLL